MMMGHEVTLAVLREGNPLGLHFGMFLPALMGQGSEEQQAEWLPKAIGMKIIGTYAQVSFLHSDNRHLFLPFNIFECLD